MCAVYRLGLHGSIVVRPGLARVSAAGRESEEEGDRRRRRWWWWSPFPGVSVRMCVGGRGRARDVMVAV